MAFIVLWHSKSIIEITKSQVGVKYHLTNFFEYLAVFVTMKNFVKKLFFNDKFIFVVIFLNSIIIYLQECEISNYFIQIVDLLCTIIFVVEMVLKIKYLGLRKYWSSGWNRLDGTLVVLSLPSLVAAFFPINTINLSFLLILRVLRVFRFFRVVHFFPNFSQIAIGFVRAIKQSYAVFIGFFLLILVFAMISCSLFKTVAPEFFATPTDAIYSIFRLFTIEGWYEIPDNVAMNLSPMWARATRVYFCLLLVLGGVIGLSLVNSVFVDAMVSDNNDDLKEKLNQLETKIDKILESKEK